MHEVRAGDLDQLGARRHHQVDRLLEPGQHAGLVPLAAELLDHADADSGEVTLGPAPRGADQVGQRRVDRGRVQRIVPADHLVQQGRVEHGAGHGTGLVEGVGERDEPVARHAAVRRLHPDRARHRTRLPDGAAGVGADGERRLVRRHGRGRAAAGPAGDPVEVPRVVRRSVCRVLGGGAHRELVHVGLAQDRQARLAEARDDRGVVRRYPAFEDPRAARRRQALGGHHVLDRDRHAVEWRPRLPACPARVGGCGLLERTLGVDVRGRRAPARRPRRSGRGGAGWPRRRWSRRRPAPRRAPRRWSCSLLVPQDPRHLEPLPLLLGSPRQRLVSRQAGRHDVRRGRRWSAAARGRWAGCRRRPRR